MAKAVRWIMGHKLLAFTICIILGLCLVNVFLFKNTDFFKITFAQALTLLVAVLFTFWATQRKNDERKAKEQIEKIVKSIQVKVTAPEFIHFDASDNPEETRKKTIMSIRKLKNNIDVLKMYDSIADLSGDVRYLEDQICEYDAFVSEKIGDLDYLSRSETHLARYSNNIDSKCDLIIAKLYTAS